MTQAETKDLPDWFLWPICPTRAAFETLRHRKLIDIVPWSIACFIVNISILALWPRFFVIGVWHLVCLPLLYVLPASRLIEIAYAFYNDSLDRIAGKRVGLELKKIHRLRLVGLSYAEVSVCYATLYLALPAGSLSISLHGSFDALYFSWMTVTTTGYGDISPQSAIARLCAMSEVGLGLFLLVVAVGAYFSYPEHENT